MRMSYTLHSWSRQVVRSQFPFWFHLALVTMPLLPWKLVRAPRDLGSHSFTRPSLDPEASSACRGCQSTAFTSPPWPLSVVSTTQRPKSQTLMRESSEQVANLRSDGAKASPRTASLCASCSWMFSMLGFQYLIFPLSSPVMKKFSLCVQRIVRMGASCAWISVSKLNVCPLQSVNSPLWVHVIRRRPSGIQCTTLIAQRTLFVLTWMNLLLKQLPGWCG
mmetsp:Transcript_17177/g.44565  ORF Transcript_17177/g.44565 Transcript_17177/m.44565 type:complete len:220 (+) Transcript_17177:665-1324(+)